MRESGFYWVKYLGHWHVAKWRGGLFPCWIMFGDHHVTDFEEINENRLIAPDELPDHQKIIDKYDFKIAKTIEKAIENQMDYPDQHPEHQMD